MGGLQCQGRGRLLSRTEKDYTVVIGPASGATTNGIQPCCSEHCHAVKNTGAATNPLPAARTGAVCSSTLNHHRVCFFIDSVCSEQAPLVLPVLLFLLSCFNFQPMVHAVVQNGKERPALVHKSQVSCAGCAPTTLCCIICSCIHV